MLRTGTGLRESGKTTLLLYLSRQSPIDLVFDPRGMVPRGVAGRMQIDCRTQDDIANAFGQIYATTQPDTPTFNPAARIEVVVTPDNDCVEDFDFLCRETKAWVQTTDPAFAFLLDEPSFVDLRKGDAFSWLARCVSRDRVQLSLTGHRPIDVPTHLRSIVDYWCLFRMADEGDRDFIAKQCHPDLYDLLPTLSDREFVRFDVTYNGSNRRDAMRRFSDPTKWYVPLSRTLMSQTIDLDGGVPVDPPKPHRPALPLYPDTEE